jgi:hypothetical protein
MTETTAQATPVYAIRMTTAVLVRADLVTGVSVLTEIPVPTLRAAFEDGIHNLARKLAIPCRHGCHPGAVDDPCPQRQATTGQIEAYRSELAKLDVPEHQAAGR